MPRCLLGLGEGHLRDSYELGRWQLRSQRGCCPCLREQRVPTPDSFQLPPARRARRRLGKRFPLGFPDSCHLLFGAGCGAGRSCGRGTGKIPCSCRPTKPLPRSKEGRTPETAAPSSVEAGCILPVDLGGVFFLSGFSSVKVRLASFSD